MQNNLTLWEESGSGREFLKYWEPMAVEGRSCSTSPDPQAGLTPTSTLIQSLVWECSAALSANIPGMKAETVAANSTDCCRTSTAKALQAGMESSTPIADSS